MVWAIRSLTLLSEQSSGVSWDECAELALVDGRHYRCGGNDVTATDPAERAPDPKSTFFAAFSVHLLGNLTSNLSRQLTVTK
jgi:hypothetical protein